MSSQCTLIITFPPPLWLGQVSKKHPSFDIQITSFIPVSQDPFVGNSLITINGTQPSQIIPDIEKHPSLIALEVMTESPTFLTLNTRTKDQLLLRALVKNFILVQLPVKIFDGKAEFNITASRANIDGFIEMLQGHHIDVEIKNIGQYSGDLLKNILTPRQLFVYKKAKQEGYYDSPRRITLSELAVTLNTAKSSLSALFQRIHKKLLGNP